MISRFGYRETDWVISGCVDLVGMFASMCKCRKLAVALFALHLIQNRAFHNSLNQVNFSFKREGVAGLKIALACYFIWTKRESLSSLQLYFMLTAVTKHFCDEPDSFSDS